MVVSAKFTPAVHKSLAEAGPTDAVDVVYGELFAEDKASALITEGATIYVGDHPGDIAAARAARAYAVASPAARTTRRRWSWRAPTSPCRTWPRS